MIEVHGLNKLYGDTYAVKDVSFQVAKGEVIGFLGPNGAGKTTTMRIIAGSLGASSGTAKIGGFDVADDPRKAQALLGYSPEVPPLYPSMIVRDFVRFAAEIKGVADPSKAADRALDRVGLGSSTTFPKATGNGWGWRKRWSMTLRFWCWTNPPPGLTPRSVWKSGI
jgi:ABC-2 type transport system ATP-binding protein